MTAKQCLKLLQTLPNNDSDTAEMGNDESGSKADWVCSSSDSEEDASEVPGPSAQRGRRRRNNHVAAPARMPATSPEAASSPVVAPVPHGTVWNTINPGAEAAGGMGAMYIKVAE
ncbi:UNVERIFIED_CONTAM: hypothetical protein FKN15_023662 [Acipenser sinensis]